LPLCVMIHLFFVPLLSNFYGSIFLICLRIFAIQSQTSQKTLKYLLFVFFDVPTAYILVNCALGSEEKIINEIAKLSDVKEVRGTYGVHDIFVKVKSDNTETMNHTVTNKIRKVPGITSTVTLVVIEEQGGKGDP
jgi:DNA-binding Lrp family transcriptional regulator